jgi:hypothetical protein
MNKADLIGGVGIAVLGLLLIFVVIPVETAEGMYFGLPPTFFPTVLAVGLTGSALGLILHAWRRRARGSDDGPPPITAWNLLMFVVGAAIAVAGAIAIDYLGIIYAGPVLIAAFMLFMGDRGLVRIVLTSTLPVALVYVMARYLLYAPLP